MGLAGNAEVALTCKWEGMVCEKLVEMEVKTMDSQNGSMGENFSPMEGNVDDEMANRNQICIINRKISELPLVSICIFHQFLI